MIPGYVPFSTRIESASVVQSNVPLRSAFEPLLGVVPMYRPVTLPLASIVKSMLPFTWLCVSPYVPMYVPEYDPEGHVVTPPMPPVPVEPSGTPANPPV